MKLSQCQSGQIITGTEASEFLPSAAPDLAAPNNAAGSGGCGGCYLVADVAGKRDATTRSSRRDC